MAIQKTIHSTLVNIDSSFRTISPKHIIESNNKVLKQNPIKFTKNSKILRFSLIVNFKITKKGV